MTKRKCTNAPVWERLVAAGHVGKVSHPESTPRQLSPVPYQHATLLSSPACPIAYVDPFGTFESKQMSTSR